MRSWSLLSTLVIVLLVGGSARAAKKGWTIVFVAPLSGPLKERSEAYLEGVRKSADAWSGSTPLEEQDLSIVTIDDGDDPKQYAKVAKAIGKSKPFLLVGAPSGRCLEALTKLARKRKLPLVLLTPWEPRFSLDAKDGIVHLSASHVDHAIWAANYAMLPFRASKVAALHDDSEPSRAFAAAFHRNRAMRTADGGSNAIPADVKVCGDLLRKLRKDASVDLVLVCGDAGSALTVATAAKTIGADAPALLFMDGLVTPSLVAAAPTSARWLEGTIPLIERGVSRYRRKRVKAKLRANPSAERGYAAIDLVVAALRRNELKRKGFVHALRTLPDEKWRDTPLCTEWGSAKLSEFFLFGVEKGAAVRMNTLYLWSHAGGTLLRYRDPRTFKGDPEGIVVHLSWGEEKVATIDDNLKRLGLHTSGYEGPMDAWVKDELLARCLAYLNKLYWRNADGTPIPGVSFDISFCLEIPEEAKGHKVWRGTIAGDDPSAGGRAFPPNKFFTYATFLERMYTHLALKPKLSTSDVKFFNGRYVWGTSVDANVRNDSIRSLVNGYAGAMALTTAHEAGHLAGLGHDTVTPRSIMNVADAKGLDPEAGEWVAAAIKIISRSVGFEPVPKPKRKRRGK